MKCQFSNYYKTTEISHEKQKTINVQQIEEGEKTND